MIPNLKPCSVLPGSPDHDYIEGRTDPTDKPKDPDAPYLSDGSSFIEQQLAVYSDDPQFYH